MVRALLDGSKTQTRRIVKMPIDLIDRVRFVRAEFADKCNSDQCGAFWAMEGDIPVGPPISCKYGQPGDRLWVRETWGVVSNDWDENGNLIDWVPDRPATAISEMPFGQGYYSGHAIYAADGACEWAGDDDGGGEPRSAWHPSIHMPRAASRILLEVVSVRVERLQDISDADALAEGCSHKDMQHGDRLASVYARLWESINGAGSWDANPWVWVVEFKRVPA